MERRGESLSSPPARLISVLDSWQQTPDARGYINPLLKRNKRKTFGLLEKPYDQEFKECSILHKKLFLVGKSGVGKTSTIDKLMGRDITVSHEETIGIQTHTLYWPVKLSNPNHQVILVQLEFWDTGERALSKYDHILPTCRSATDGTLIFFSYEDRKSWNDLPRLISSMCGDDGHLLVVVGTHSDSVQREVTSAEVEAFQLKQGLVVLPIANNNGPRLTSDPTMPDGREVIKEISPFLNTLTQVLLAHEQKSESTLARYLETVLSRVSPEQESFSQ